MANKKIKRVAAMLLLSACCSGLFAAPAFAQTETDSGRVSAESTTENDGSDKETASASGEDVNNGLATDGSSETSADTGSGAENPNALTPSGNMKLVDDIGETTGEGKQFITVQSKSGQTFYIIIDRDKDDNSSVYFLNQVDEAELLSMMDEDDVKEYAQAQEEKQAKAEEEPAAATQVTETGGILTGNDLSAEEETAAALKKENPDPTARLAAIGVIGAAIIGILLYLMRKRNKGGTGNGGDDPDRDYPDGYDWEEEDDDVIDLKEEEDDGIIDFDEEFDDEEPDGAENDGSEPEWYDEPDEEEPEPDPFDQKYSYRVYDLDDDAENEM